MNKRKFPPLFLTACTFLCLGVLGIVAILFLVLAGRSPSDQGFLLISSSFISFGIGEILNHPKKNIVQATAPEEAASIKDYYLKRNTCGLGNLLIIVAILLFFVGLSSLIK